MPPRRPGGKYRGAISRFKGEETLAQEFEEGRSRMLQKYIKDQEDKKRDAMMDDYAAKFNLKTKDKAIQMKIVSHFIGHKSETLRFVLKGWIAGLAASRKEREVENRIFAWRSSCEYCGGLACDCQSYQQLTDVAFKMPFELGREAARRRQEELEAAAPDTTRRPLPLPSLQASPAERRARTASCTAPGGRRQLWPCRCMQCFDPASVDPSFLDIAKAKTAVHFKTGRRVYLDESKMRFVLVDVTRMHTRSSSSLI